MESRWWSLFWWLIAEKNLDINADFAPWAILMGPNFTFNSANNLLAAVTASQISVPTYAEKQITDFAMTHNAATNSMEATFTIPAFGNLELGQTVGSCVIYHKATVDSYANPLALWLNGSNRPLTGGAFTVTVPATPISLQW